MKTPEQIRSLVADANDQFKNAISYKPAPCLLVIFHDGIAVPDEEIIESALYGDLKYVASKERPHEGMLILDENGAWNSTQSTTTSAVMYIRNASQPLIVHNRWAQRKFPPGIFQCKEISAGDDGKFKETDYSPPPR